MRVVIFALCGLLLGQLARADDIAKEQLFNMRARDFTQKLQGKVLPGWIVLYEEKDHEIRIIREHASVMEDAEPNPPPVEEPIIDHCTLYLEVLPVISTKDYLRMKNENRAIQQKLDALYKVLSNTPSVEGIQHEHGPVVMPSTFHSAIPADQAKIDEYYRLEKSLLQIPDGYFQDLSLAWSNPDPTWNHGYVPRDDYVRSECEVVFKQANAVFCKY